jgi:hypothetical protein
MSTSANRATTEARSKQWLNPACAPIENRKQDKKAMTVMIAAA